MAEIENQPKSKKQILSTLTMLSGIKNISDMQAVKSFSNLQNVFM